MSELIELNDTELDAVSGGLGGFHIPKIIAPNIQTNVVAPVNVALWGDIGKQEYHVGSSNEQNFFSGNMFGFP